MTVLVGQMKEFPSIQSCAFEKSYTCIRFNITDSHYIPSSGFTLGKVLSFSESAAGL